MDKGKLPRIAFARKGEAGKKSTWGFPHHWVQGGGKPDANGSYTTGTLYLHKGGLRAAWSAANGGRSGKPAEAAVKGHLRRHMSALGLTKKEMLEWDPDVDIEAVDAELLAAGLITQDELDGKAPSIAARIRRVMEE